MTNEGNKVAELKISNSPVILIGCPFISESIKARLEEKMKLFLERNMIAIVDYGEVKKDNKKANDVFYLSSICQGCGSCDVNSAKEIIENLNVDLLCTEIIMSANQKHPIISK